MNILLLGALPPPVHGLSVANAKFAELAAGILPDELTRHLIALCRDIAHLDDAGDVARAAAG